MFDQSNIRKWLLSFISQQIFFKQNLFIENVMFTFFSCFDICICSMQLCYYCAGNKKRKRIQFFISILYYSIFSSTVKIIILQHIYVGYMQRRLCNYCAIHITSQHKSHSLLCTHKCVIVIKIGLDIYLFDNISLLGASLIYTLCACFDLTIKIMPKAFNQSVDFMGWTDVWKEVCMRFRGRGVVMVMWCVCAIRTSIASQCLM